MLRTTPVTLRHANAFVKRLHRHHGPCRGARFVLGAWDGEGRKLVGVAIVGRPVARQLDHRRIAEVNRLCTDGTRNACSMLYAAAARAAQALGYYALVTYTLSEEGGGVTTSCRVVGRGRRRARGGVVPAVAPTRH